MRGAAAAALLQIVGGFDAAAADWYTGAAKAKPASDWIVAVDASATATSSGTQFAAVASTFALGPSLNVSGPRLRIEGLGGSYTFSSLTSGEQVRGQQAGAAMSAGYQWISPRSAFSLFGGIDVKDTRFSGANADLPAAGVRHGLKTAFEYYATPTDRLMLFAFGSYSTIYNAYYAKLKLGVGSVGGVYVGPELAALGDDFYRQWRVGAHVTGIQLGGLQLGFSAGYQLDKGGRGGGYGSLDLHAVY